MTTFAAWCMLVLIAVSLLGFVMDPVRFDGRKLRLNRIAPLAPALIVLLVTAGMQAQGWRQWQAGSSMIAFFGWGAYAALMFGYEYDGTRYSWFNGLWRRSVSASEIRRITFLNAKKRTGKVLFECEGRRVRARLEFSTVWDLVVKMAQDHAIEHHSRRLPWWSV
ncbi:hypothetical protein ANRL1_01093 [Anaerolineae bacterium]|nr:hypothetical protein ANRL1_01093 [Anaerolineae bacterium]